MYCFQCILSNKLTLWWFGVIGRETPRSFKNPPTGADWGKLGTDFAKFLNGMAQARRERLLAEQRASGTAALLQKTSVSPSSITLLWTYNGHSDTVYSVVWSPNGIWLASASGDKTVLIWNTRTGEGLLTYNGYADAVYSVAWSPDGSQLASGGKDRTVQVWDAQTGKPLWTYRGHADAVRSVAWSPLSLSLLNWSFSDSTQLTSMSGDETLQIGYWNTQTGKGRVINSGSRVHLPLGIENVLSTKAVRSPDGTRLALFGRFKTVWVYQEARDWGPNIFPQQNPL